MLARAHLVRNALVWHEPGQTAYEYDFRPQFLV